MEKVALLTKDDSLREEFSSLLPKEYSLTTKQPSSAGAIIFFDIDTLKPVLIRELTEKHLVIAVTRQKRTEPVIEATIFGSYEVIHRPVAAGTVTRIVQEVSDLRKEIKDFIMLAGLPPAPTCAIVGHSPLIMDICKKLARLSQVEVPVLVTGETGTGKELIAESIAQLSSRFGKPFVVVNCAAVPETLLEAELFGFEKGSFTGAVSSKEGMLKIADEGCVFFDEVGELPLSLQGKLLRFLQTQTFYPLGSTREMQVNVRTLSATNRDLTGMVKEGKFREDLYHRLRVSSLHIPPLRERKEDIPPLIHFFVDRYRHTAQQSVKGITKAFLNKMISHDWPGNIRELENTIRSAIALTKTPYLTTHELKDLGSRTPFARTASASETLASVLVPLLKGSLEKKDRNIYDTIHTAVDRAVFEYILSYTKENQSEAARLLGINRLTLRKKLKY
ncbi:MAG: sigma-54 dependent transcriptional regulator [Alphaproteobacteria bacterium]|uniref:Sigma-54 dependent transcriptional regulator n=1 Tax=Candidatus Nitrobium versatile TaxID=2884831 RepID=A0A953LVH4_9BACT|nr:sigma-54 dependent transcriptional regulator [Candidatus Nitrobium versatile]